ncbi:hypothetical protein POM88_047643 [Heracleum sosnowskyi]|uniref:DUF4283 domain-containing protein n=1 Tax=Heracleum sosnowskyi TaxID=360622 RepID=A0AAD8GU69_9APIA|nr:hypothetical protein POM88_047643 [Heracleum sosnowskyi]
MDVVNPPDEVLLKAATMNAALSRDTWYIDQRPMVVTPWGADGSKAITFIPPWLKLSRIPDYYWTQHGLSCLTRVIATTTDPVSGDKYIAEVNVSYFNKPLICEGCKSLGHTVAACQKAKHIWVVKQKKDSDIDSGDGGAVNGEGNSEKVSAEPIPDTVNDCETSIPDIVCDTPLPNNDG